MGNERLTTTANARSLGLVLHDILFDLHVSDICRSSFYKPHPSTLASSTLAGNTWYIFAIVTIFNSSNYVMYVAIVILRRNPNSIFR